MMRRMWSAIKQWILPSDPKVRRGTPPKATVARSEPPYTFEEAQRQAGLSQHLAPGMREIVGTRNRVLEEYLALRGIPIAVYHGPGYKCAHCGRMYSAPLPSTCAGCGAQMKE